MKKNLARGGLGGGGFVANWREVRKRQSALCDVTFAVGFSLKWKREQKKKRDDAVGKSQLFLKWELVKGNSAEDGENGPFD